MAADSGRFSRATPSHSPTLTVVTVGVGVFAAYQLLLAAFMALAPHTFFTDIGPFGSRNDHYVRDIATYNAALGFALAVSLRQSTWRIPVLALTTVQFTLHSINHLVDIDRAHPTWNGYFDFFSLTALSLLLAWLSRKAMLEAAA